MRRRFLGRCGVGVVGAALSLTLSVLPVVPLHASALDSSDSVGARQRVWDLAKDFRLAPNQANPSPDRYGNADVWSYSSGVAGDPSTYVLLPDFNPARSGVAGVETWEGRSNPPYFLPEVGVNATGGPVGLPPNGTIRIPDGVAFVHPYTMQNAVVVGWRSPVTRSVAVGGRLAMAQQPQCGNGVGWSLWKNADELRSGVIAGSARGQFKVPVQVTGGDSVYFVIDPRDNFDCDTTLVGLRITAR